RRRRLGPVLTQRLATTGLPPARGRGVAYGEDEASHAGLHCLRERAHGRWTDEGSGRGSHTGHRLEGRGSVGLVGRERGATWPDCSLFSSIVTRPCANLSLRRSTRRSSRGCSNRGNA